MRFRSRAADESAEARERHKAERAKFYSVYDDPQFADFIGENHICQTCYAVAGDMPRHIEWHRSTEIALPLRIDGEVSRIVEETLRKAYETKTYR